MPRANIIDYAAEAEKFGLGKIPDGFVPPVMAWEVEDISPEAYDRGASYRFNVEADEDGAVSVGLNSQIVVGAVMTPFGVVATEMESGNATAIMTPALARALAADLLEAATAAEEAVK